MQGFLLKSKNTIKTNTSFLSNFLTNIESLSKHKKYFPRTLRGLAQRIKEKIYF